MIERSPVVAALLFDGLERAKQDAELGQWIGQRLTLIHSPSQQALAEWQGVAPDVVYMDPMFPHRKKSAAVKKEMKLFQQLLGHDADADGMLTPALALANKRVVVKRPASAPYLASEKPNSAITSKKHRFDVYFTHIQRNHD
jgi:16S rRNA (guanine1516-N2)-methyltransferase